MELTFAERWILSNQYRILEELLPDQASDFARAREVVERGYEYWYSEVSSNISEETMSEEEGQEVNNILFMFRVLNGSYTQLLDKEGIDAAYTTFRGFDGNDETRQFAFAQFRYAC